MGLLAFPDGSNRQDLQEKQTMKLLIIAVLTAALALADTAPQRGARGGCYIITKSKTGKVYKRYVDKSQCK